MLFKSKDETDEVVLLDELLDVLEVGTVGAAVDKLAGLGYVFSSDRQGRVAVLSATADELRRAKEKRDKVAAGEAERQRIEAERRHAEAKQQAEQERAEREAEEAKVRVYRERVRRLEEAAGMNVTNVEMEYRRWLRTRPGEGFTVSGQREQWERPIGLAELERWVDSYIEKEVS